MSTQTSAQLPSTTLPPPPTDSSSGLSNTSSLLFGFLVSALSVFAIFMTVAVIWNRLVARRRTRDATSEMSPPSDSQWSHRPTMWDVWAVPDNQPPPWVDAKPLAVLKCDHPSWAAQAPRTVSFWRHCLVNRLPPEIADLCHRTSAASGDTDTPQVELSHGSDIQVSILISMPRASQSKQEQRFHETVLATTNVLYHDPGPS